MPREQCAALLYSMGSSLWKEEKHQEAQEKLTECITLRKKLKLDATSIKKAEDRLAEIQATLPKGMAPP